MLRNFAGREFKRRFSTGTKTMPTKLTKLPNGIRVITDEAPGHFSAMGIFVDAGSRYESQFPELTGHSHIIDRLAFKSTSKFDGKSMVENTNHLGGNFMCASSRESLIYQASVFNKDVDKMAEILSSTVKEPLFTEEEVSNQIATADYELDELWLQPDLILPELSQQVAYGSKNLGSALLCPKEALSNISRESLLKYREIFFRPENLVVAMLGVPHEKALELVNKNLGDMKSVGSNPVVKEPAKYTGGELSLPPVPPMGGLPEFHHIYLTFEGVPVESDDVYSLATLQMLVGGGGSFSAGGPGKGMYARAYTRVLNQYGFIESCNSYIHNFSDSGLFGVSISSIPQANKVVAELLGHELSCLFSENPGKGALTDSEVKRAKNQLRSSLLMNLESKMVQLEELGRHIQVYGRKVDVTEMCDKISKVTKEDLVAIAKKVLTGSKPTIVVQGDRESYGDIEGTLASFGVGSDAASKASRKKTRGWF
ncbi:BA75_03705T0 [Komagataella pastoris]|uniref:BA75_03705T0 n=1 Tax=Komagataella pastoris TaxID=4922 RepID=A0A1B2JH34_PICPA|nr:BA75_03705T0 [Komagataella pastoris]